MQQFTQNTLPSSFNNMWSTNQGRTRRAEIENGNLRELRNQQDIYLVPTRLISTDKHPLTCFPTAWKEFTNAEIKFERNRNVFKSKLKKALLSTLSSTIICNRLLCPACHLNYKRSLVSHCQ